ncbi:hypothetical protein B0T26DRAFT_739232 [Lasiosphaeria miniovina]|uniref:NAD(P)-binding domain-containing protein n=1 Tax=Lasiosphaeria miniovina TaxID=1954250 RepID=A0AA40ATV3_9PEZI|nr:uncharacterized protein B0T26DRAFT_739232 [Lasiosphaeria miniovina]KAK0721827.1 hypothetical protein B0T26DRAFT_739232 [Lasiosphaeria miniovina]
MKLIVAGSTGFVAGEVIRQALSNPAITSVVALGRREAVVPDTGDASKLKSVICNDFENYPDDVKQDLEGADACIWTIAVTPSKSKLVPWETTVKVSRDYALRAVEQMSSLSGKKPFRFVYLSGVNAQRDQAKKPWLLGDYTLLRGEAESRVLELAEQSEGAIEPCIAKAGIVNAPGHERPFLIKALYYLIGLPKVENRHMAAALLDQVVNGFEKDTLMNDDLDRIGRRVLV